MKSLSILTAFASTGAFASAINYANLQDRAIDPATMNPTLLSVLSVLKTAMPTGPNAPMPTGDLEPNWYQQLPGDVKSLLPELYPAAAAVATSEAGAGVVSQAQSTDAVVRFAHNFFDDPSQRFSYAIEFPIYWQPIRGQDRDTSCHRHV
ncbi:hypothetical protein J4E91_006921 [Alternaria rosae]|nr:hypothetical protein J4E91_006921 [Alternaria rosae]